MCAQMWPRQRGPFDDEYADLGSLADQDEESTTIEDTIDSPRDTPLAVLDYGTGDGEVHEPLAGHLARELPEVWATPGTAADAYPEWYSDDAPFAGRLVSFSDEDRTDTVAHVAFLDTGGYSAEEAAMHLVAEPEEPEEGS